MRQSWAIVSSQFDQQQMALLGFSMILLFYYLPKQVTLWLRNPVSQWERECTRQKKKKKKSPKNHFAIAGIWTRNLSLMSWVYPLDHGALPFANFLIKPLSNRQPLRRKNLLSSGFWTHGNLRVPCTNKPNLILQNTFQRFSLANVQGLLTLGLSQCSQVCVIHSPYL